MPISFRALSGLSAIALGLTTSAVLAVTTVTKKDKVATTNSTAVHLNTPKPTPTPTPTPAPAPAPEPAFLDVVTFKIRADGENHKMIVTRGPSLLRIDEPDDRYSLIYDVRTDHYIGLEHSNYTYWEFSWPEVRAQVETSKRYESHLRDLNSSGLNDYQTPTTNAPDTNAAASSPISVPDNSSYVWKITTDHKELAGIDCTRWQGETVSGESVEAWCSSAPLPKVQTAMESLRAINEPIALVPVRMLVPPLAFIVYDGLTKGGVTPVSITWGADDEKSYFNLVEAKVRETEGKLKIFSIPDVYNKTTLVTMDGILNPVPGTRVAPPEMPDRPQHPALP